MFVLSSVCVCVRVWRVAIGIEIGHKEQVNRMNNAINNTNMRVPAAQRCVYVMYAFTLDQARPGWLHSSAVP